MCRPREGGKDRSFNVSSLFFEIALLLLPGFISMKIHPKFGAKGEITQFDMILNAFLFGVIAYAVLYIIYWKFGIPMHIAELDVDSKRLFSAGIIHRYFRRNGDRDRFVDAHFYGENYKLFTRFGSSDKSNKGIW